MIVHFDDDDYYAPHYVRYMVDVLQQSKADVVRLLSWLTYGEGFIIEPTFERFPIVEWEEQRGFGWAYSYAYTRRYGAENPFSKERDAGEEKNFVGPFENTFTTEDVLQMGNGDKLAVRVASGPHDDLAYSGPSRAQPAPRSLRRALLTLQVNTGSLYRCCKRT